MKDTQLSWVKERLGTYGRVSRNEALANYITRLAARVADLERSGWVLEGKKEGRDYVYTLISCPPPKQGILHLT